MKARSYLDAQKTFITKQGEDRTQGAQLCRQVGIRQGGCAQCQLRRCFWCSGCSRGRRPSCLFGNALPPSCRAHAAQSAQTGKARTTSLAYAG